MDRELIEKFSPYIMFDKNEPFYPVLAGVTLFDKPGKSPSTSRFFDFEDKNIAYIIEYAIYWDYDIQHLYELEHIWVYVDHEGRLYHGDASFHGRFFGAMLKSKVNVKDKTHIVLYSQPGKHAFMPMPEFFELLPNLYDACGKDAGKDGLLQTEPFRNVYETNPRRDEMVCWYLRQFAFKPAMEFTEYRIPPAILVSWEELREAVPRRIEAELELIGGKITNGWSGYGSCGGEKTSGSQRNLIVFLDCGDTLIDEDSEIRNYFGEVISAKPIPGAPETLARLREAGYRLAMVADGMGQSFKNIIIRQGWTPYFETLIFSENIRADKPSPRMFKAAMGALELSEQDIPRIVMVGNNLERDICGANRMGFTSVHLCRPNRVKYRSVPRTEDEKPDYTIASPGELLPLLDKLDRALKKA